MYRVSINILSVIVPIYNIRQDLLKHCIASIQQNLKKMEYIEVLLINDGSTQADIEDFLLQVANSDCRFKYIFKPNSGVSNTRNMGIELARGEFITFIDADDYLEPDSLRYMLATAQALNTEMIMFGFCHDDKKTDLIEVKQRVAVDKGILWTLFSNDMTRWYEQGMNLASVWAKIYKRDTLLRNQLFFLQDIAPNEDGFYNLCLLNTIPEFYIDNTIVYHYVTFAESAIHRFSNRDIRIAQNLLPRLRKLDIPYNCFSFAIAYRTLLLIKSAKQFYFTHPQNQKSFRELKKELGEFLSTPIIRHYVNSMRLLDAKNLQEFKNIILLKLHLYWIFLITERRKRRKQKSNQNNRISFLNIIPLGNIYI